jgi:cytochrome c
MRSILIAAVAAAALSATGGAFASEDLAKSAGCNKCHAMDSEKDGPSYKAISKKFKGKDAAAVASAFKASKEHAKVKAKDEDVTAISGWILKL